MLELIPAFDKTKHELVGEFTGAHESNAHKTDKNDENSHIIRRFIGYAKNDAMRQAKAAGAVFYTIVCHSHTFYSDHAIHVSAAYTILAYKAK